MIKKFFLYIVVATTMSATTALGAVGFNGTALANGTPNISDGDMAVWLISDGTSFGTISVTEGDDIFDAATYGAGFTYMGTDSVSDVFGSIVLQTNQGISDTFGGLSFAALIYETSTTTADSGDAFRIWTDASWVLPTTDGVSFQFNASPTGTQIQQLNTASQFNGTVQPIPEPSVALLGALGGLMLLRRRRND